MPDERIVPEVSNLLAAFAEVSHRELRKATVKGTVEERGTEERPRAQTEEPPPGQLEERPGEQPEEPPLVQLCEPVHLTGGPEHTVEFRQFLPLQDLGLSTDFRVEPGQLPRPPLSLGCITFPTPLRGTTAELGFGLCYQQLWYFREQVISSLATAISLAPGETLSMALRNTQRKQLTQETLDQVEQMESSESTSIDKDVLNVTRSSSKTNNWTVNGNASFTVERR